MKENFKGKPFGNGSEYGFLSGEFGKEFLKEYKAVVNSDYHNNPNLSRLEFEKGVPEKCSILRGSFYSLVLANSLLKKEGLRIATLSDLPSILDSNKNLIEDYSLSLGLVLRKGDSDNFYLSKLKGQAKKEGYTFSDSSPLLLNISDLEVILDSEFPEGLRIKIGEFATPYNVPKLGENNDELYFNELDLSGFPNFLNKREHGEKRFYSVSFHALSELILGSEGLSCTNKFYYGNSNSEYNRPIFVIKD